MNKVRTFFALSYRVIYNINYVPCQNSRDENSRLEIKILYIFKNQNRNQNSKQMDPPTGFVRPLLKRHVKSVGGGNYSKFQLHYQFNLKKGGVKNNKEYERPPGILPTGQVPVH